jgi:hypothetical protein
MTGAGGTTGSGGVTGAGGAAGAGGTLGMGGAGGSMLSSCTPATSCSLCEQSPGNADACPPELISVPGATCLSPAGAAVPAFGCDGFTGVAQANCLAVRACIQRTHCGVADDPTACLCGPLDPGMCVTQGAPATAPCAAEYAAAAVGFPGNYFTQFFDESTPIGIANNLFGCDVDAPCVCP